ncbi:MAG: hypothetical protein P8J59_02275 [Phycisphaerales bacterium]|jgi:hypothetical protein|nr:hypothetical protein [Phycisphaerales bacterium]
MSESTTSPPPVRGRPPARISGPAVLAALSMVAAAILFGIYGPRMQQRGIPLDGTPLADLLQAISRSATTSPPIRLDESFDPLEQTREATRDLAEVLGPGIEPPVLDEVGLTLVGSAIERNLAGTSGVQLIYESRTSGERVFIFEVADAARFTHFDPLGRHLPLLPGARVVEEIEQGAERLGLVILGIDGHATVIIAINLEKAVLIADVVRPVLTPGDSDSESSVGGLS